VPNISHEINTSVFVFFKTFTFPINFSFNFPFILIFYWSLKRIETLGYGFIFIAGMFNDAVLGFPIGISSLTYLIICGFAAYLRNITLRPSLTKDWLYFLFTILVANSINYFLLILFFSIEINYYENSLISKSPAFNNTYSLIK